MYTIHHPLLQTTTQYIHIVHTTYPLHLVSHYTFLVHNTYVSHTLPQYFSAGTLSRSAAEHHTSSNESSRSKSDNDNEVVGNKVNFNVNGDDADNKDLYFSSAPNGSLIIQQLYTYRNLHIFYSRQTHNIEYTLHRHHNAQYIAVTP